jgi:hypothetical protein
MDQIKLWEIIPVVIIATVMTLIVLPSLSYLSLNNFYKRKIIIHPGTPVKGINRGYWNFPFTITNNSHAALRNVVAFITIEYDETDIREDPGCLAYKMFPPGLPLVVSWQGISDGVIKNGMDIEKGATVALPVFGRHPAAGNTHLLQVASENGMASKNPCTLFLNGEKDYDFAITVIAGNIFPITKEYRFNLQKADILETEEDPVSRQELALMN